MKHGGAQHKHVRRGGDPDPNGSPACAWEDITGPGAPPKTGASKTKWFESHQNNHNASQNLRLAGFERPPNRTLVPEKGCIFLRGWGPQLKYFNSYAKKMHFLRSPTPPPVGDGDCGLHPRCGGSLAPAGVGAWWGTLAVAVQRAVCSTILGRWMSPPLPAGGEGPLRNGACRGPPSACEGVSAGRPARRFTQPCHSSSHPRAPYGGRNKKSAASVLQPRPRHRRRRGGLPTKFGVGVFLATPGLLQGKVPGRVSQGTGHATRRAAGGDATGVSTASYARFHKGKPFATTSTRHCSLLERASTTRKAPGDNTGRSARTKAKVVEVGQQELVWP